MRLFLGIELPLEIKTYISRYLEPLKVSAKGWEDLHDYHQTLLFIGEVTAKDLETINHRLDSFHYHPFKIQLTRFQFFNRRIMYLGMRDSEELMGLKRQVDEVFREWCRTESKPFLPHITVKRWQRYEYDQLQMGLARTEFRPQSFEVAGLTLFKSEKDALNRKYHVIKTKRF